MNYIAFQKKILSIAGNNNKLTKFNWGYKEGYYYISLTGSEIYRLPSCYMFLNLGLIKLSADSLPGIFEKIEKSAEVIDVTLAEHPGYDLSDTSLINPFDEVDFWYDLDKLNTIGTAKEIKECCHFRAVKDTGALIVYNEGDEAIFMLLPFKRRNSNG